MVKVSEMLPQHPIADECRRILGLDLDEQDIATAVQVYQAELNQLPSEEMLKGWFCLNSTERASWKLFVNYSEWLAKERARAYQ
jgi:hypothetical protein